MLQSSRYVWAKLRVWLDPQAQLQTRQPIKLRLTVSGFREAERRCKVKPHL
jgi:hypothetical protein